MASPEIIKFKFNPNPDPVSINDFLKEGNHTNNLRKSEDLKQFDASIQNFIVNAAGDGEGLPARPPEQEMWAWDDDGRLRIVRRPFKGGRRKSSKRKSHKRKSHKRRSHKRRSKPMKSRITKHHRKSRKTKRRYPSKKRGGGDNPLSDKRREVVRERWAAAKKRAVELNRLRVISKEQTDKIIELVEGMST